MNMSSFLTIDLPCDQALQMTKQKLTRAGLRALQTFDLHDARSTLHDCACPNHGTETCDCQMVVLLVYGKTGQPVTLFLHGNDGRSWLSFGDDPPQQADPGLLAGIRAALKESNFISDHA